MGANGAARVIPGGEGTIGDGGAGVGSAEVSFGVERDGSVGPVGSRAADAATGVTNLVGATCSSVVDVGSDGLEAFWSDANGVGAAGAEAGLVAGSSNGWSAEGKQGRKDRKENGFRFFFWVFGEDGVGFVGIGWLEVGGFVVLLLVVVAMGVFREGVRVEDSLEGEATGGEDGRAMGSKRKGSRRSRTEQHPIEFSPFTLSLPTLIPTPPPTPPPTPTPIPSLLKEPLPPSTSLPPNLPLVQGQSSAGPPWVCSAAFCQDWWAATRR